MRPTERVLLHACHCAASMPRIVECALTLLHPTVVDHWLLTVIFFRSCFPVWHIVSLVRSICRWARFHCIGGNCISFSLHRPEGPSNFPGVVLFLHQTVFVPQASPAKLLAHARRAPPIKSVSMKSVADNNPTEQATTLGSAEPGAAGPIFIPIPSHMGTTRCNSNMVGLQSSSSQWCG